MAFPILLFSSLLPVAAPAIAPDESAPVQLAQMSIHQRIVIRFPVLNRARERREEVAVSRPSPVIEKKGPKCLAIPEIEGASMTREDSVDLVTADGAVMRARFDDRCPAMDFYEGFYMRRTSDGMVCAGRDALKARSGADCRIKSFKRLVNKR
jgi:hypothetical protein